MKRRLLIGVLSALPLIACGEAEKNASQEKITGEEVRREVGEAVEATKGYLRQRSQGLQDQFESRMEEIDSKIAALQSRADQAGAEGRTRLEGTMEGLRARQEEAQRTLEELKESGAELTEEAWLKMEDALTELERAYARARKDVQ